MVGGTIEVDEARKRRWDGLNAVLDINKKARYKNGHMSVGYSYANWEQVKGFFHLVTGNLHTTTAAASSNRSSSVPVICYHLLWINQ